MSHSKLKILHPLIAGLALLFVPILLEVPSDGKAYAMGFLGKKAKNDGSSGSRVALSDPDSNPGQEPAPEQRPGEPNSAPNRPTPVPEPATWLLFGAGAAGLAAFRKKFKKK